LYYAELQVQDKAMNLSIAETMDNAQLINEEEERYNRVNVQDIFEASQKVLNEASCSTLYYKAKK
jgi:zinc protease